MSPFTLFMFQWVLPVVAVAGIVVGGAILVMLLREERRARTTGPDLSARPRDRARSG